MSGPIRFMILAIVIGIKKSRICLFRKKVVQRSIHSYRIGKVIFPESDLPDGVPRGSLGREVRSTRRFSSEGVE
jgi:hypothetical protein